uniref:Bifunctional inhibitor/plant lipid transfer protein/seed storage helical domain-containing protein n=1 Tax=Oryza punctata TaxID=4537 RepID=A0A0E0M602_ORYPU
MAPKFAALLTIVITMSLLSVEVANGCGDTSCSNPTPPPPPAVPTPTGGTCPINVLDLAMCANVLSLNVPSSQCCTLLQGLTDVDAALCLCAALKANILGVINVDVLVDVTLILSSCNRTCPPGFTCPL